MLKEEFLRRRTELTQEDLMQFIQSEINNLTPDEIAILTQILREIQLEKHVDPLSVYNFIVQSEFEEQPVDLKTFLEDDYYLGSICREGMYPQLKQDFIDLFSGDYEEIVLTG
jgi:hypothetical protein